jgi:Kef-type K+ transport system membrane component KefB
MANELVGLSMIVGSFLVGAYFAGVKLIHDEIFKEEADQLQTIFASISFVFSGIIIDPQETKRIRWSLRSYSDIFLVSFSRR